MRVIAEQELQGMGPLRQGHHHLGLAIAEMDVVVVGRDWLIRRAGIGVDQQVVMAGAGPVDSGRSNPISFRPIRTVKRSGTRKPSSG